MANLVVIGVSITFLVILSVIIDCISLAMTVPVIFKLQAGYGEDDTAMICNGATLVVSFFTLLFITAPSAAICCSKASNDEESNCCTPTYYVSIIVAELIAVIGTMVAGILLIFSVSNYEENLSDTEVETFARAAVALNLTAAGFSVVVVIVILSICMPSDEKRHCCSVTGACAFIGLAVLMVTILVAALLTIFYSLFVTNYSDGGGYSPTSSKGAYAALFSAGAAGALIVGMCFCGPPICCTKREGNGHHNVSLVVSVVWALLTAGTIVGGGLMMKVGNSFATGADLNPEQVLNRASISTMAYLIGALNFITTLFAFVVCSGAGFRYCTSTRGQYNQPLHQSASDSNYVQFTETVQVLIVK